MTLPKHTKVLAYVTRGRELLVFTQPASPSAGVQVPAGTIEPAEEPAAAIEFRLRWIDAFDASIELAGYQGDMLPALRKRLTFNLPPSSLCSHP
jgi:hypothetical protein